MIDGSVTVGPNAVLALKREGYRKRDFSLSDTLEILGSPAIRRVLQGNLRSGLGEMKNSLCKGGYLRLVQKYCPSLALQDLQPWPAGRPRTGGFSARQADRRFSVRHHRALHSYLQCALPGCHIGSAHRGAYRRQSTGAARPPAQPRPQPARRP
ncbi:L-2-hydroxyglutarate oxidase LhgO [Raoultella terrigena]|uniref:L-2-hydroxyglutarate oxidase LhgO n=1 Tax=Raoultella terrigena TaxID=577 RepID=A0A4U9D9D1_RAOTE|nr:L-2-hydroxyglutarate oxidase LhgO [Raoultella terrigena]